MYLPKKNYDLVQYLLSSGCGC